MLTKSLDLNMFMWLLVCSTQLVVSQNANNESTSISQFSSVQDLPNMTDDMISAYSDAFNAATQLSQSEILEDYDIHSIPFKRKDLICSACKYATFLIIKMYRYYVPPSAIKYTVIQLCTIITGYSNRVCKGLINLNVDIIIEILEKKDDLNHQHVCGTVFEYLNCYGKKPVVTWGIKYDYGSKPIILNDDQISTSYDAISSSISVAHITDSHFQEMYEPGALAECNEPMCCRNDQEKPANISKRAGVWGDYRSCDIPWNVIDNTLRTVKEEHKEIKYVYWTGDLVSHNVWDTSRQTNIASISKQAKFFQEIFGCDVPIFPVVGNHESHPTNVFSPPYIKGKFSSDWIYEAFYENWFNHLPKETKQTFLKGGYYTVSPSPGFRIIGINTNLGYTFNWWLILDPVDPADQLSWLAETLHEAEKHNEKVHILAHSPTGVQDMLKVWSREYHRIINRFEKTVVGQFQGHTHKDQFYVFYGSNTTKPSNTAFNGGSITTYTNVNPNYKIYIIKKRHMESNLNPTANPKWFQLYSFREAYNLSSLKPKELNSLVERLATDNNLFNKYMRYYTKNADVLKGCDKNCKKKRLCEIVTTNSYNKKHCKRISKLIK